MKTKMKIKKTKKIVTRLGYGSGLEGEGNGKSSSRGSQVEIVCLYEFPNKWNPREINSMELVLQDERGDRIHCSILKSNMVFISYEKIEAMVDVNKNHLLDCIDHVVGREDITPLVTKSGEEKNIMKCTPFGDLVDKALGLFDKDDGYQSVNLVSDELHGGSLPITTIEEVLDKTNVSSSIVATVVSIDVGGSDWYYASCKSCPRKLKENKGRYLCEHSGNVGFNSPLRYRLHVIAADGTGYIGLIIWNQEAKLVVGKSASEVKDLSGVEQSVSNLLPTSFTNAAKSDVHFAVVVSLSKVCSESIFECGLKTPGKGVVDDSNAGAAIGVVYNPNV
ncbi:Putative single-stranded DNA binding protein [Arachis hypogaea]|nr:Putative single-stranded DNA binding protein [Arachis hypogaea]